jgi:hypothetical protein
MKNIISAAAVLATVGGFLTADMGVVSHHERMGHGSMMMNPHELRHMMHMLKDKKVEEPKELIRSWLQYKAKVFKMKAEAITDFAAQIKDSAVREKWDAVAKSVENLGEEVAALPIPEQKLMKSFKYIDKWLELKAEKADLVSQEMLNMGEQFNNKKMMKKGLEVAAWAAELRRPIMEEGTEPVHEAAAGEIPCGCAG